MSAPTAYERTPPNDEHAERDLLGHVLGLGKIPATINGLAPSDFYRPANETIWAAMRSLDGRGQPCDLTAVRNHLREHGSLDTQGGVRSGDLSNLTETAVIADPGYTAEIIRSLARRRQAIESYQRGLQRALDPATDIDELTRSTVEDLARISGPGQTAEAGYSFLPGGSFILDTDPEPKALWGDGEEVVQAEGEALIIAAPQGAGKTTLAQQLTLGRCGFPDYLTLLGFHNHPRAPSSPVSRHGSANAGGAVIPADGWPAAAGRA